MNFHFLFFSTLGRVGVAHDENVVTTAKGIFVNRTRLDNNLQQNQKN